MNAQSRYTSKGYVPENMKYTGGLGNQTERAHDGKTG